MIKYLFNICYCSVFFLLLTQSAAAEISADYSLWLNEFRVEAQQSGISPEVINRALSGVEPLEWIINLDRAQPEFKKTLKEYLAGAVTEKRIKKGQRLLTENLDIFSQVAKKYQVQPRFLTALWGIETDYGRHTGKVPVIDALVTLAYDSRRDQYFRSELLIALQIVDQGQMKYGQMKGSWAGAMGQVQFMPSTFLNYAVDGNSDGCIDLWNTREDYLSSAANYLFKSGWNKKFTWGREVTFPENLNRDYFGMERQSLLSEWQKLGVRTIERKKLPNIPIMASLIQPDGPQGRAFLVYENYRVLLKWNRAHSFAVAVGTLADRLGAHQVK